MRVFPRMPFVLALILSVATAATTPTGAANSELHHAGLVIRHGEGQLTYAYMAFSEDQISGFDLLERTGIDQVAIPFGSLGQGVCSLEGEGCPTGECRRNVCQSSGNAPYWRYFRQVEPGMWEPAPLGASQAKVRDGTIDAWVWTSGGAGLPALSMDEIRALAGVKGTGSDATDAIPTPAVRSGFQQNQAGEGATLRVYLAAAAAILLVGATGVLAVFRSRRGLLR